MEAHHGLGQAYLDSGDFVAARHEFQRAIHLDPNDRENVQLLVLCKLGHRTRPSDSPAIVLGAISPKSRSSESCDCHIWRSARRRKLWRHTVNQRLDAARKLLSGKAHRDDDFNLQLQDMAGSLWNDQGQFCGNTKLTDKAVTAVLASIGHEYAKIVTGLLVSALTETQRFLLLALLIGMFAGLLVVSFHICIDFVSWTSLGALSGRFRFGRLLSPALGALASVYIVKKIFPKAQGSGVNQTKAAIYTSNGYVPSSTILGKFIACALAIGSGNSLGPEDPSLQMGAGIASRLGRLFQLSRQNMRLIAPVGAAAGIAAAFNTPITGVLFVMEEVLADWSATTVGSIVLAAVSAVVTMRAFLGNEPLFRIPAFELTHVSELLVYAGIGIVGGVFSAIFIGLIEKSKQRIEHLPAWTTYVLPASGRFFDRYCRALVSGSDGSRLRRR